MQVPDHILDMVAERAKAYTVDSKDRWLGGFAEAEAADIFANSTHHLVDSPQRRELHRKILQEVAQSVRGEAADKPTLFYICGPMAAGKSELRSLFDERLNDEDVEGEFDDPHIEAAYQAYAKASQRLMVSDFGLYKQRLPEFEASGNEFAIIRAEASALDQAVAAWAKELKVNTVLEQLGDGIPLEWAQQQTRENNLVVIGVTVAPHLNAQRLQKRNERTGEKISMEELAKTIRGFSAEDGYPRLEQYADLAVLMEAEADGNFVPVHSARNRRVSYSNNLPHMRFLNYRNMTDQALFTPPGQDAEGIKPDV